MCLECIENICLNFVGAVFDLNGFSNAGTNNLHELFLLRICVNAGRNLSHQHNQQEAEELNE